MTRGFDFGLTGKHALVTGAASGIGKATAELLAQLGCETTICDIQCESLDGVLEGLGEGPHSAICFDLGDSQACQDAIDTAMERTGRLDIVVNTGAVIHRAPLHDVTIDSLHEMTAVNMWGSFFLARAAAESMAKTAGGSIVLFSSQGAFTGGHVGSCAYSMTKAAVGALIKSLAGDYASRNVRVNGVAPGAVDTPMMRQGMRTEEIERFLDLIPMKRMGRPEEIALCCAYLASEASQYVTGQMLHVNGGLLMY